MQNSEHAPALADTAKSVADQARAEGRRLVDTAKADLVQLAESQKHAAGSYLSDLSSALRKGSQELRGKGRDGVAGFGDSAADGLESLRARIDDRSLGELWGDFEEFAHRHPGLLFGAALLAGFGATRLIMSGSGGAPHPTHPQTRED